MKTKNMKQVKILSVLTYLLVFFTSCQDSKKSNLTLFSDQIPTDTPLVFGSGIISTDGAMEFAITFSPEMDEMYFTRRKPEERNNIFTTMFLVELNVYRNKNKVLESSVLTTMSGEKYEEKEWRVGNLNWIEFEYFDTLREF